MKLRILLCCVYLLTGWHSLRAQLPAIGGWRDHLSYHRAIAVAGGGDTLICATPYSVFTVDLSDKSIRLLSKSNGLNGAGIAAMGYDSVVHMLTLLYTGSAIDMVKGDRTYSIPAVKNAALPPGVDRSFHSAYVYGGRVYVASGLGIIVLDEAKQEISDNYIIGSDGDTVAVWSVTRDDEAYYAATGEGLKRAVAAGVDLADYHNWELLSMPGSGVCRQVTVLGGQVIALQGDSIYSRNNGGWLLWYADGQSITDMTVSGGRVLVTEADRVVEVSREGAVLRVLGQGLSRPLQAMVGQDKIWVADSVAGLVGFAADGSVETYVPNSPLAADSGALAYLGESLWVANGGLSVLQGGDWTNYPDSGLWVLAVDPHDSSVWAAGTPAGGLVHRQPGDVVTRYDAGSTGGLAVDVQHNLWITHDGAGQELSVRQPDGSQYSFSIPFSLAGNRVGQVLPDDYNQLWIQSPGGNGVVCYSPGKSISDGSDDQWKYYQMGAGQGNLPDSRVYCMAKDKSGFIWIGTANGIGVVQCAENVFQASGCEAVLPVVQFDAFAGYLFSGQMVQAIAVDGADRKWVGTRNGVWLISADAQQIIYHFTADSTPLLSNDVRNIAIDPVTGEVFFGTLGGLCSFRSTATKGGEQNNNVLVFPNPVPPGFGGTIAIRGLVDGAIVKITQLDGRLIYQTRALGGQAIWDGRDYRGRRIVSGIYLVLASSDDRSQKVSTKIVFIGK